MTPSWMGGERVGDPGTPEFEKWKARKLAEHRERYRDGMLANPDLEPQLLPLKSWSNVWGGELSRLPYTSRWGYDYRNLFDSREEAIEWWRRAEP